MRMACMAGREQTGHWPSPPSHTLFAQSMQKKLWPHGTKACVTLASLHTRHLVVELNSESAGLVLLAGDGREGADTVGYDQMLDRAVDESKLGESPNPSSRSLELQMAPKSLPPPLLDELLEHEPELEKAPLLPVDEVIAGNVSAAGSM